MLGFPSHLNKNGASADGRGSVHDQVTSAAVAALSCSVCGCRKQLRLVTAARLPAHFKYMHVFLLLLLNVNN